MSSYEESKARCEAFADALMAKRAEIEAVIEIEFWRRFMHGQPGLNVGKECSVSYGWCFTHMDKALKPRVVGASVGPFCITDEFDAHPGPSWGSSPYTLSSAFPHTLRRG